MKKYFLLSLALIGNIQALAPFLPPTATENRAIIIGADTGIGKEIAFKLINDGYIVGLMGSDSNELNNMISTMPPNPLKYIAEITMYNPQQAKQQLETLINDMGGLDLLIIASPELHDRNTDVSAIPDDVLINIDIKSFYVLAEAACTYFEQQHSGHLVGFTSIDSLRGSARSPLCSASKAFCSHYLEGKRNYFMQKHLPIYITDIRPGWLNSNDDNNFVQNHPGAYWVASSNDALHDIMKAIQHKEKIAYITSRWQQVAHMLSVMPDELYNAIGGL